MQKLEVSWLKLSRIQHWFLEKCRGLSVLHYMGLGQIIRLYAISAGREVKVKKPEAKTLPHQGAKVMGKCSAVGVREGH